MLTGRCFMQTITTVCVATEGTSGWTGSLLRAGMHTLLANLIVRISCSARERLPASIGSRVLETVCRDALAAGWLTCITASLGHAGASAKEVSSAAAALSHLKSALNLQRVRSYLLYRPAGMFFYHLLLKSYFAHVHDAEAPQSLQL